MIRKYKSLTPRALVLTLFLLCSGLMGFAQAADGSAGLDTQAYQLAQQMVVKGKELVRDGQLDMAEKTFVQCLKMFPRHADVHFMMADIYHKKGYLKRALEHIRQAEANGAVMKQMESRLKEQYLARLQSQKERLEEQIDRTTNQKDLKKLQGNVAVIDEWLTQAQSEIQPAAAAVDGIRYAYLHGSILFRLKQYGEARSKFREVARLNSKYGEVLKYLAIIHFALRENDQALAVLDQAEKELGATYPDLRKAIIDSKDITRGTFELLSGLSDYSGDEPKKANEMSEIRKFMSVYSKFYRQPELLTPDALFVLYKNYQDYNVVVDYAERIPLRKYQTLDAMFNTAKTLELLGKKNRPLNTSVFQALLELLAHTARYAPDAYDYDALVTKIARLPYNSPLLYDDAFRFLEKDLGVSLRRKSLLDVVFTGMPNQTVKLDGIKYVYTVKDSFRKMIKEILDGQRIGTLRDLLLINKLMDRLPGARTNLARANTLAVQLVEAIKRMPYAEISKEAPKPIRDRVVVFKREKMLSGLDRLLEGINSGISEQDLKGFIITLKSGYLVHYLRDHLMGTAYALNAKNPKLKAFLNPNMVRLHDFGVYKERDPWNYSGTPPITDEFSTFSLCGGLSRLGLAFGAKWHDQLFGRSFIYNHGHVQGFLINMLDLYPVPRFERTVTYHALMTDFGLELLEKARIDEILRPMVVQALETVTSGYHYRKSISYVTGKTREHQLFFTELERLGEWFFSREKELDLYSKKKELKKWLKPGMKELVEKERHAFGNIYYRTFGSLQPRDVDIFPHDVASLFNSGWTGGEMFEEFKVKLCWHLYQKKIPPVLLGQILYTYLTKTVPRAFSQNHVKDYFPSYFVFSVFNNANLRKMLKDFQKKGYLKLK